MARLGFLVVPPAEDAVDLRFGGGAVVLGSGRSSGRGLREDEAPRGGGSWRDAVAERVGEVEAEVVGSLSRKRVGGLPAVERLGRPDTAREDQKSVGAISRCIRSRLTYF